MRDSLLFPAKCIFCGAVMREAKLICAECAADEVMISGRICAYCGLGMEYCTCEHRKYHYERRIACTYYKDAVCRGIARFKFYRHTMLGEYYGLLMAENIRSKYAGITFDGIVYVPMHPIKQWLRGYNCTQILSEKISRHIGLPILDNILYKHFSLKDQKRVRQWSHRAGNVLGMFYVKNKERLKGKTILLIDDVCTSGATLNECAKMLRLYGAKKVYAATFSTAIKHTR